MSKINNNENLKKTFNSKNPLNKENIKTNYLSDDTDNLELNKQEIDDVSIGDEASIETELSYADQQDISEVSEDDLEEEIAESKLKKLLKKFGFKKKKKKGMSFLNSDLAPTLGNEGLGANGLSEQDMQKKRALFSRLGNALMKAFINNPNLRNEISNVSKNLQDQVSVVDEIKAQNTKNMDEKNIHKSEHIKQLAHAINDLGMNDAHGKWAEGLSDSDNLKDKNSKNWQDNISNKEKGDQSRGR